MTHSRRLRPAALGAVVLALVALGADETQTIEAEGLTFQAPAAWKKTRPTNPQMRKAQLRVEPAKGDQDPAELVVFKFPGGAGTVEANIARWRSQFADKDGQ